MSGSSGLYTFNPGVADVVLDAFERCGIADLDNDDEGDGRNSRYMQSAQRSLNFVAQMWANKGINLWTVTLESTPLSIGSSPISVDGSVMNVLDVYLTQDGVDLSLYPLSRDEYAAIPNKAQTGRPTSYWYDRLISSSIFLWPLPDQNNTYTLNYYVSRRIQDASPIGGQQLNIPYMFYEAFTAGLAAHLAIKWSPDRAEVLDAYAQRVWQEAADENREKTPLRISPDLSSYFN